VRGVWDPEPAAQARAAGAQVLLVINASPYEVEKQSQREQQIVRARVAETGIPLVFVNLIGGQDELVFDGNSFVMSAAGEVTLRAPAFTEGMYVVDLAVNAGVVTPLPGDIVPLQSHEESVYGALVQGTRDYVDKHRFPGVILGLRAASIRRSPCALRSMRSARIGCKRWQCRRGTPPR